MEARSVQGRRQPARAVNNVKLWATILAAVAVRIERLKTLARTEPQRPASTELSDYEIKAVCILKRRYGRVRIAARSLTIGQAVTHIAEIGGYTGKSSGGPPGSTTIGRGLERVRLVAEGRKLADEVRVTSWNKRVNLCRSQC